MCPRLGVCAVQDGECMILQLVIHLVFKHRLGHEICLFIITGGTDQLYSLAFLVFSPDLFENLIFIVFYYFIGGVDNGAAGTLILFKFKNLVVGIVFFKIQDILDVGTAKGINTLGIIAHDTNIFVVCRQLFDY